MSPGNAGGAKGSRKVDEMTTRQPRLTTAVPFAAKPVEGDRVHMPRFRVATGRFLMLTIHKWGERYLPLSNSGSVPVHSLCFDLSVLFQVKPPTGEPCAGDRAPPAGWSARFGGEGDRELNRSSLPLSRHCCSADHRSMALPIGVKSRNPIKQGKSDSQVTNIKRVK